MEEATGGRGKPKAGTPKELPRGRAEPWAAPLAGSCPEDCTSPPALPAFGRFARSAHREPFLPLRRIPRDPTPALNPGACLLSLRQALPDPRTLTSASGFGSRRLLRVFSQALRTRARPPHLGLVRSFSWSLFPSFPSRSLPPAFQLPLCRAPSFSVQNRGPALDLS